MYCHVSCESQCIMVKAVCVCVCLSITAFPHYLGNGTGCPLVVHYLTDLHSVRGFRCYDNIAPNAKCQRVLMLALCLVFHLQSADVQLIR